MLHAPNDALVNRRTLPEVSGAAPTVLGDGSVAVGFDPIATDRPAIAQASGEAE